MKITIISRGEPGRNAGRRIRSLCAATALIACLTGLLVTPVRAGQIPSCPTQVTDNVTFPSGGNYVCAETDNYWLDFVDYGGSNGITSLPEGTIFHIDSMAPGEVAITIEPSTGAQFLAGDTYKWGYDVVENSFDNEPIAGIDADFGAEGTIPALTVTPNDVDVLSYHSDGTPNRSVGGQIASLDLNNGALQEAGFAPVLGVQFTDTLTGIGADTTVQSVSNSIDETPEPGTLVIAGLGLIVCGFRFRRCE